MSVEIDDFELVEEDLPDPEDLEDDEEELALDPSSAKFVELLVDKMLLFLEELCEVSLYPYQREISARIMESLIIGDGEEITGLVSRQAGKSETVANTIATCMILLPRLAKIYPDLLGKYKKGLMVGTFAPVESQAETLFSRLVSRLTSDRAIEIMMDSEIDDVPVGASKLIRLKRSGSFCRMQTANPKAKIESKSYHIVVIDEAQGADEYTVRKSIHPMLAHYNGTIVKIGTPDVVKGDFYKAIQRNKRRQSKGRKKNHFEFDWRHCARWNKNYRRFVTKEMSRIGEDSDEFQLSYALKWLLERGMFVTESVMDELGDTSMQVVRSWYRSPVLVGIDPARKTDSTVVTVVWVDWDRPDEFGFFDHRILNWLELHGEDWEAQYAQIWDFLQNYSIFAIAVDAQGMGGPVAERLGTIFANRGVEVVALGSNASDQAERWKHLTEIIQRRMIGWPAHSKTRRLRVYKRFHQQMIDAEKRYQGPYMLVEAPHEADAHDDFVDSLALACILSKDSIMPEVEVGVNPLYERTR